MGEETIAPHPDLRKHARYYHAWKMARPLPLTPPLEGMRTKVMDYGPWIGTPMDRDTDPLNVKWWYR